ncbi:MAG: EamA family transporter [Desulfotalea sp.]
MFSKPRIPKQTSGLLAVICSVLVLSTTGIIIRHISVEYEISPLILSLWRNVFLVIFLATYLKLFYPFLIGVKKKHISYLILYGFILSLFNISWQYSVAINGAGVATVLVCMTSLFTLFLARLFFKENLGIVKIVMVLVAFIGAILVTNVISVENFYATIPGLICGLLSALCYSAYGLFGKSASNRGLNPWTTLLYTFAAAGFFILIYIQIGKLLMPNNEKLELLYLGTQFSGWGYILLLALGPTLVGFGLCNVSLSKLPASNVSLFLTSEPVFTMVLAFYLLGETLVASQIFGSGLILSAVVFLQCYEEYKSN